MSKAPPSYSDSIMEEAKKKFLIELKSDSLIIKGQIGLIEEGSPDIINLQKLLHKIKGGAGFLGLQELVDLTVQVKELLNDSPAKADSKEYHRWSSNIKEMLDKWVGYVETMTKSK